MSKPAQTFVVTLRTQAGADGIQALRTLLKQALRRCGLRCIDARETSFATTAGAGGRKIKQRAGNNGDLIVDMSKFNGSHFLKVADVELAGSFEAEIAKIEMGKFDKPNLHLNDGSVLSLNATNNKILCRAYGSGSEGWIGQRIKLSVTEVDFQGQPTQSISVKPISPSIKKEKKKAAKGGDDDAEMNDSIDF